MKTFKKIDILYIAVWIVLIVGAVILALRNIPVKHHIRKEIQCISYDAEGKSEEVTVTVDGYYYNYILETSDTCDKFRGLFYISNIPEANTDAVSFMFRDSLDKKLKDGHMYYPDNSYININIYNMDMKLSDFELSIKYYENEYSVLPLSHAQQKGVQK